MISSSGPRTAGNECIATGFSNDPLAGGGVTAGGWLKASADLTGIKVIEFYKVWVYFARVPIHP